MQKLQITHPDGRVENLATEDAFGSLEAIFGDVEIGSNGPRYWIEELDVSAVAYDDE